MHLAQVANYHIYPSQFLPPTATQLTQSPSIFFILLNHPSLSLTTNALVFTMEHLTFNNLNFDLKKNPFCFNNSWKSSMLTLPHLRRLPEWQSISPRFPYWIDQRDQTSTWAHRTQKTAICCLLLAMLLYDDRQFSPAKYSFEFFITFIKSSDRDIFCYRSSQLKAYS